MPVLRLSWLGPPAIQIDDRPVHLEMRKTLALLAYLSLSPQNLSRETLAAIFWPEFDQRHSLSNLRRNLYSLSRSLPPGLLEADRESICLRRGSHIHLDVEEFRGLLSAVKTHPHAPGQACPECLVSLGKAAAIYKGDFLNGFNLKDSPEFDDWQLYQRETLRLEYAGALEKLVTDHKSRCEWGKAIDYARAWVALDRLNESAQRALIGLYGQSGQRSLALRQYDTLAALLQNELGQAPEADTVSLYKSLHSIHESGRVENGPALHPASRTGEPLIKTKLYIPPIRLNRVTRPRLFDLLDAGAQRSLTLISAPAGFGKTTLLASWAAHTSLPIAWFSMDEGDNDPARFVAYLIAALDGILPAGLGEQFQAFTQSLRPSIQLTLVQLINQLAEESAPFVLILDDYQVIHSQEVHQVLAFLLEKIPACMHLVIATRSDPPFSLALLRGRDQLVEIRMSDLRFRSEESAAFLQQVMVLELSNEDVSALEARTEGWIAGLQMAGLAIRLIASQGSGARGTDDSSTVSRFIKTFSGSNRYILDYLGDEVLGRRPEETRQFLLQTSILERFSGPLCDAVLQVEGSQKLLEALEKENLFVVPLDSGRHWYRYHQLFAELLAYKLDETLSGRSEPVWEGWPGLEVLHLRAANWLEKNQLLSEAVHHYLAAKKFDQAAAIIESQTYPLILSTGQTYTLREWLAGLPADLFQSRPRLNIARAWTLILQDQLAAALDSLAISQQALQERQDADANSIRGEIALIRGVLAELRDRDVDEMRVQGFEAWEKLPRADSMLRGIAAWLLGASYAFAGDTRQAEYYLSQAIQLCQEAGNIFISSVAVQELGLVRMEQGKYRQAYHLLLETLEEWTCGGRHPHPSLVYLYYVISQILYSWNQLDEAERQLKLGIDLVAQDIPGEVLLMTTSILPYIKLAQGKRDEALFLAEKCLHSLEAYPFPYIHAQVKANLIRFWIRVGSREHIEEWFNHSGLSPDDPIQWVHEVEYIALSKVLIWLGRPGEALKVLDRLHQLAQSQGRDGKLFYIRALQALAWRQAGDLDRALETLESSLKLAQSEGYVRPYLEEDRPMEELLQLGAARGLWQRAHLDSYADRLLKALQADQVQTEENSPAG